MEAKFYILHLCRDTEEPAPHEAEDEYWKIVSDKDVHMQVRNVINVT